MKLRFILLAYTLLMAGFLLFMGRGLSGGSERGRDMVFYNQQQKQVEEALGSNETRRNICDRYGCELLFFTDADYQQQFRRLVQERAVIPDLWVEGAIAGKIYGSRAQSREKWLGMRRRKLTGCRRTDCFESLCCFGGCCLRPERCCCSRSIGM